MASIDTEIKIENICRTCMSKEDDLQSIFDVCYDTMRLDFIISTLTGVQIEQGDGLPSTVCRTCEEKAANAFEFKKKTLEVDVTLRDLCSKEEKEVKHYPYQNDDDVKTEEYVTDDQQNYMEFGLEDLSDMDMVKNECEQYNQPPQCKNCTLLFNTYEELQDHLRMKCFKIEIDESSYCPLCGVDYYDAVTLTKHMRESHAELMGPKKKGRPRKILTSTIIKLAQNGFHIKNIPEKRYNCTFCDEEFKTKEDVANHFIDHKDTKLFCCLLCKKYYLDKLFFDQHVCSEEGDEQTKVLAPGIEDNNELNYLSETTLQELLVADNELKQDSLLQVCRVCSGVFMSEGDIVRHNDMEHPELSFRCNLCNKTKPSGSPKRSPKRSKATEPTGSTSGYVEAGKTVHAALCLAIQSYDHQHLILQIFASLKSAGRHRSICKQIERKHRCNTCGLQFAYEISLNKHILRYHEGQSVSVKFMDSKARQENAEYKCDNCDKLFYRKDLLIKHTRIHSEKYYECDVCKKKFNRSDNLRSHKRTHEPREKTKANASLCLYCGRSFNNSSNLIVHMRRHTGEKPYKCDFCGKGFPRSSDLQCHRRSHTGEKPCVCGVCGKGFSRSNKLSRHMRVHTGLKPYKCTYCDKAFSQSNDLTLHIRRHTGDKPYICEICGDRFIQGTALHNHRRTHGHYPPSSSDTHIQIQGITYTVQNITPQEINQ